MKVRTDFVTNSSSSSFIISKDNISHDKLLEILLEMTVNEEGYEDNNYIRPDDDGNICVGDRYRILEATEEIPLDEMGAASCWGDTIYTNHYIIKNTYIRFDTDIVVGTLTKYNIPWEYGYCD